MDPLPPLNPLRAFEAAGRLRSIRAAAAELKVTPGAVSRQVQALERHLGAALFRRPGREVVLTEVGERYLETVSHHLVGLAEATRAVTGGRGREVLRILAHTTVSMKWLIPRLALYRRIDPETEVRLTTSNETVDFARERVDGAVRLGDGDWPGLQADRLLSNELIPLCSPAYAARQALARPQDLAGARLLHSLVRPHDWKLWLAAAGVGSVDPYAGDSFASTTLAYQAALQDQGVLVAQRSFFQDDLDAGRLVQPFGPLLDRGRHTYYLIYPKNRLRNPAFRRFRTWLLGEGEGKAGGTSVSPGAELT